MSLVAVALVATAAPRALADAALLPVMAPDLLEPQKRALDERIRALAAEGGVAIQAAADTTKGMEQAKKAGAACNIESLACQAQMGVLLGTEQVIVARVASDWAGDRLELRLLDALRGETLREAARLLPKDNTDAELRNRVADGVILSVLAPGKTGAIDVTKGSGALFLDTVEVPAGATHIEGVAPGRHELELRLEGKASQKVDVVVKSGEAVKVSIGASSTPNGNDPDPDPDPTKPTGGPSLGLILVGSGAVLALAAGATAGGLQATLDSTAIERPTRDAIRNTGIGLLGATALGVLVAGAGGVLMATASEEGAGSGAPPGSGSGFGSNSPVAAPMGGQR